MRIALLQLNSRIADPEANGRAIEAAYAGGAWAWAPSWCSRRNWRWWATWPRTGCGRGPCAGG